LSVSVAVAAAAVSVAMVSVAAMSAGLLVRVSSWASKATVSGWVG
jgi:hypothetical protein